METFWIDITDIPAQGREFSFSDPEIWAVPAKHYAMEAVPGKGMEATLLVIPQGDKCLVTGRIAGTVSIPCDRCTEPASFSFEQQFETFEELVPDTQDDREPLLREHEGKLELDAGTILWEQFVLALPVKPLCSEDCKGLCPHCGVALNMHSCDCGSKEGDPRLAILRGLKFPDKDN
ncbi:MAG: DUF177 domain-containing protein [Proteobacteria bacterium]|nr:DUF177 domain-containing protein [Pseudomonadota bacterium]